MKRMKRHKIKKEKSESSSKAREQEEHDLAYYLHDRVELMHQVFSLLKYKELKAMAPECVRNLAIGDLQELCTEELLGISSKRLLAILDGAEPPSDTESSSPSPPPDQLETISLDSISSDEELLAASSNKKKKHKHRHHSHSLKSKSKKKENIKEPAQTNENTELSKASRAGLTVLELLELQARARAIRAQLQQEQAVNRPSETTAVESSHHSSDNEIEIKEEPPDVVEISSEDEKPDVGQLKQNIADKTLPPKVTTPAETVNDIEEQHNSQKVTKHINDLIITVPKVKQTRKIKLNRNKVTVSVPNDTEKIPSSTEARNVVIVTKSIPENIVSDSKNTSEDSKNTPENSKITFEKSNDSKSKKKKKDKKKKKREKDGSDHDEITLQLSDSEKMDLLEDLDESRKNYDKVSSNSEDSESSSSESEEEHIAEKTPSETLQSVVESESTLGDSALNSDLHKINSISSVDDGKIESKESNTVKDNCKQSIEEPIQNTNNDLCKETDNVNQIITSADGIIDNFERIYPETDQYSTADKINDSAQVNENTNLVMEQSNTTNEKHLLITSSREIPLEIVVEKSLDEEFSMANSSESKLSGEDKGKEISSTEDISILQSIVDKTDVKEHELTKSSKKDLSDGELSDRESSEVEAIDIQPEVVHISDEDTSKVSKKKKKKDKKSKKEKKSKKTKSDFRDAADQNFYRDSSEALNISPSQDIPICVDNLINLDSEGDNEYEILELSDDSSCYEVEGTVLSKEPTAEEIEALSAKIDEIERYEVVTDEQIRKHEQLLAQKEVSDECNEHNDNISWKDRYLDSNKVKKVLTTANIFNALRKKNKELKKKIQDSKNRDVSSICNESHEENNPQEINIPLEGSIEQYNALQGSTTYVDPVKECVEENIDINDKNETKTSEGDTITKEMKKDAKQLLKMYKKLLKYNDMHKQSDPNKKKKKKQRKKDKESSGNNAAAEAMGANIA